MNSKKSKMMMDHLDGYIKSVSADEENDEDFVRAIDNMYNEVCVVFSERHCSSLNSTFSCC